MEMNQRQSYLSVLRRGVAVALVLSCVIALSGGVAEAVDVNVSAVVDTSITFNMTSTAVALGAITPDTPVTGSSIATVTTSAQNGYAISARHDTSFSHSMRHTDTTTYITEKTPFTGIASCSTAVWSGYGFGVSIYSATTGKSTSCWGTGTTETDALNKYAGFPTTGVVFHNVSSGPRSGDSVWFGYKLNVDSNQKSGTYSGPITYTGASNP